MAANDEKIFKKFKSNRKYREILQHVTRQQGREYTYELNKDPWIMSILPKLISDEVGMPFRYTYPGLGRISSTDLRYAKVVSDLRSLFGPLDNYRIAEIGCGYGGQAIAISKVFNILDYALYDLQPALQLAMKYIKTVSDFQNVRSENLEFLSGKSDLLISNYAFSELSREVQEEYFTKVIQGSSRGYVIYNQITPLSYNSLTAIEFAARIPGAEILHEEPLTASLNVLVVWGHMPLHNNRKFRRI